MSKRSLIVLSICLVVGAGIALYVWADNCCSGDALCNGGVVAGVNSCVFTFSVYHNLVDPPHDVYLYIKKDGDPAFVPHLTEIGESPQPLCVLHVVALELDENSTYYYYFQCEDCDSRDPDGSLPYSLMTGDCGG
ncbi:MAG TPA: hypothetical protein VM163_02535 [bacterium]|nr:hypothetical protein [bacterium]